MNLFRRLEASVRYQLGLPNRWVTEKLLGHDIEVRSGTLRPEPDYDDDEDPFTAAVSAVIRSSWSTPPEVWSGAIGHWKKITSTNNCVRASWGEAESVEWKSDQYRAQGCAQLLNRVQYDTGG